MGTQSRTEKAIATFRSGYNCSQAVFHSYCDLFGVDGPKAKLIAAGFGGGIGGLQQTCGAVTGAVMLLGLHYYDENDVAGSKRNTYEKVREFVAKFESKNETAQCLDLLGVDLSTEAGRKKAKEEGLFEQKCEQYVIDVCNLLEDTILPRADAPD